MKVFRVPVYQLRMMICAGALAMLIIFSATGRAQKKESSPELLPTGQAITPTAAPLSHFQTLKPGVKGFPNYEVGYAVSTAISPDGGTLLVLTSGHTQVNDAK